MCQESPWDPWLVGRWVGSLAVHRLQGLGAWGVAALSSGAHAFPLRISKPEKSELLTGGVRTWLLMVAPATSAAWKPWWLQDLGLGWLLKSSAS